MQPQTMMMVAREMIEKKDKEFTDYKFNHGSMRGNYENNSLFIYYVQVNKSMRHKGLFRDFCNSLYTLGIGRVVILAVESHILDSYLQRFVCRATGKKFKCVGGDYVLDFR